MKRFLMVLAVTGCTEYATQVPEAYVSRAQYNGLSCAELRKERYAVIEMKSSLTEQQNRRAGNDVLAVGAGMVVWPAFLLVGEGTDPTTALALAKGHHTALDAVMLDKKCQF